MTNKTTHNFKMLQNKRFEYLLTVVLCAPLVLSAWRKLMPGMPAQYEALEYALVLLLFIYSLFLNRGSRPLHPLSLIAIVTLIACYTFSLLISFQYGTKFVAVTFITRMVPLMMIFVATKPVNLEYVLYRVTIFYSLGVGIMIPFGLYGIIAGQEALPTLMAPTELFIEAGKNNRGGTSVFFGIFFSNVIASWTYFSFGVLCLFMIEKSFERQKAVSKIYAIGFFMALIMVLLCTKRLTIILLFSLGVLTGFRLMGKRKGIRIILFSGLLFFVSLGVLYLVDKESVEIDLFSAFTELISGAGASYLFEMINMTNTVIFKFLDRSWFGSGLGIAGPEGRYMMPHLNASFGFVESGLPLWIIEMGLFSTLLSVSSLVIFIVLYMLLWSSSNRILSLFIFFIATTFLLKECTTLCGPYFSIILFWYFIGFLGTEVHPKIRARTGRIKRKPRFSMMSSQNPKPFYPR